MRNLFRNRKFQIIILIIVLFVVSLVSIDRFSDVNVIRNIVSAPVNFVQKGIKNASDGVTDFFNSIRDYSDIVDENDQLVEQLNALKQKTAELSNLEGENERLRDALLLKNKFQAFTFVGANVLSTNPSNYKYEFLIDVGTIDKVKNDDPVIASNNALLGRVNLANLTSSTVVPLIDELSGISGWIKHEDGGHVTIRGSVELKEKGYCIVENIPMNTTINIGDVIETSGLGGIYPKGIIIGTVVEVFKADTILERYAYLEPLVQMKTLSEVYILTTEELE